MHKPAILALALLVPIAFGLSGCAPASPSSTVPPTPGSKAAASPPPVSKSLKRADLCDVLPVEEVATLTGLPLTYAINVTVKKPLDLDECLYADAAQAADRVHQVSIDVAYGGGAATLKAIVSQPSFDSDSLAPVSGIGDSAQAADDGLAVQYGNDVVATVDGFENVPLSRAVLTKLVTTMHDRLD